MEFEAVILIFLMILISMFIWRDPPGKPKKNNIDDNSDKLTPVQLNVLAEKEIPKPKKIDKLSIIEQHKVASIVIQNFDWITLAEIRSSLLYKEELMEAIDSLNNQLKKFYSATRKKHFLVLNRNPETTDIDLVAFGLRLIMKEHAVKVLLDSLETSVVTLATFQDLEKRIEKSSKAFCRLSMSAVFRPDNRHLANIIGFCDLIKISHKNELEITGVAQKIKQVSKHIESEKELVETIYGCFEEITKSTKENIEELLKNKDIRIDQYGPVRIRMLNFSLLLNIRSVLETEIVKNILNRINEVTDIRTTTHNKAVKPSQPKADKSSNEHIVVVAQTATKIAKDFDYTSLLEILPVLSEYTEFKSAIDSIHKKLFPLYEKELKLKFDSENPDIKEIDEYLEQCKMFGEKLILDSEIIKEHQEKYFKREKKEVHQKPDEGRVIEKTHAWKDLKDDF